MFAEEQLPPLEVVVSTPSILPRYAFPAFRRHFPGRRGEYCPSNDKVKSSHLIPIKHSHPVIFSVFSPMILINIVTTIDPVEMNKLNLLFCLTDEKLNW